MQFVIKRNSNGLSSCIDRKSTRLNSSHITISYAVFCLKKKKEINHLAEGQVGSDGGNEGRRGRGDHDVVAVLRRLGVISHREHAASAGAVRVDHRLDQR